MKDNQVQAIARQMGISPSAVSKALNHCAGIGSELREQILTAAGPREGADGRSPDVYVILPDTPAYFWRRVLATAAAELTRRGLVIKCNVYSRLGDQNTVDRYLEEAEALSARALLVAAHHPGLSRRLSQIAGRRAVFSLLEEVDAVNVFFFGSDRTADGTRLAKEALTEHPHAQTLLLVGNDRIRMEALGSGIGKGRQIQMLSPPRGSSAAQLARLISRICEGASPDLAVCTDGTTATLCMALKKCGLNIPCYGFEEQPTEPRYRRPGGDICQDIEAAVSRAADALERYLQWGTLPDGKYCYVESVYRQREIT